jgi:DNA-binding MarR family transcriptional regulator
MTGLVDTLERDGLVTRQPDRSDRRMLSVTLTAKGHSLLDKILPKHFQRMSALMDPLSEAERKILVQLLGKILQRSATLDPAASPSNLAVGN